MNTFEWVGSIGTVGAVKIAVEIAFQYAPRSGGGWNVRPGWNFVQYYPYASSMAQLKIALNTLDLLGVCALKDTRGYGSADWNNGRFPESNTIYVHK